MRSKELTLLLSGPAGCAGLEDVFDGRRLPFPPGPAAEQAGPECASGIEEKKDNKVGSIEPRCQNKLGNFFHAPQTHSTTRRGVTSLRASRSKPLFSIVCANFSIFSTLKPLAYGNFFTNTSLKPVRSLLLARAPRAAMSGGGVPAW